MRFASLVALMLAAYGGSAGADTGANAMAWLKKMTGATRHLNYSGTFVYHHSNDVKTSRVTHFVDASGEYEKLETLDGPSREIVRTNDTVVCYLPDSSTILVEKRNNKSELAGLLPEQSAALADNYAIRKGEVERVANFDCQWIVLEPKDNLRYGHRFCAEVATGLLLRAQTISEDGKLVESFAFAQLKIGSGVTKDMVKSKYAVKSQGWTIDRSGQQPGESSDDTGWEVKSQPAGFRKLVEMKRSIARLPAQVSHIVYSDGLAAVSVFIEPLPNPRPAGPTLLHQGGVNIYSRPVADRLVRVVGEAPAATVQQIGDSVGPKSK